MNRTAFSLALLATCSAHAFVRSKTTSGAPIKWTTNCIEYKLNEIGSADVSVNEVEVAVTDSFDQWQAPDCSDLRLSYGGRTRDAEAGFKRSGGNQNIVVWRDTDGSWEHQQGIIAVTTVTFCTESGSGCPFVGAILDADIELNGEQFTFTSSPLAALTRFDVRNTVTHEAGHFLGLDHTPISQATMFASAPPGERSKGSLHQDDIQGICTIYPTRAEGPVCVASTGTTTDGSDGCTQTPGRRPTGLGWALVGLVGLLGLGVRRGCRR